MRVKIAVAVALAFFLGLGSGVVLPLSGSAWARVYPNAMPFLLLLATWVIAMAVKLVYRKPKC
jgi:hypothetical protein